MQNRTGTVETSEYWVVRIRTDAHLEPWLGETLAPLALELEPEGTSLLTGTAADQAAVFGILLRLRDSGVSLNMLWIQRRKKSEKGNQG